MFGRRVTYLLIGVLAIGLVVGSLYVIMRPEDADCTDHSEHVGRNRDHASSALENHDGSETLGAGHGYGRVRLTLEGQVVEMGDGEIVLRTVDRGLVTAHVGPSWYWDRNGYEINVGDAVKVIGLERDGEFAVVGIENETTGQAVTLRDDDGHPAWAAHGWKRAV